MEFAIGARRTAPLWRLLDGVPADGWTDAVDMTAAQVAVADYCPTIARPGGRPGPSCLSAITKFPRLEGSAIT